MILHTFSQLDKSIFELVISSLVDDDLIVFLTKPSDNIIPEHSKIRLLAQENIEYNIYLAKKIINMDDFIELTNQAEKVVNW
jgi:hypothetical protein